MMRKKLYAILLLSVFLPATMASYFHHHDPIVPDGVSETASVMASQCPVCHFVSTTYVGSDEISFESDFILLSTLDDSCTLQVESPAVLTESSRAPPVFC